MRRRVAVRDPETMKLRYTMQMIYLSEPRIGAEIKVLSDMCGLKYSEVLRDIIDGAWERYREELIANHKIKVNLAVRRRVEAMAAASVRQATQIHQRAALRRSAARNRIGGHVEIEPEVEPSGD